MQSKRRAHYVLSTHWDREWYQTFQRFRERLVSLLDRVLAGFADGRLRGPFQVDGQVIPIEDYLEIRPERRAEVEDLCRRGLLVLGPWYALPDEFLVSGESLVRNLRLGRELARSLGGHPSRAGFLCDMFGHTGQMPQILAGFGIRGAFLWRGTNTTDCRNVLWRGADGTTLPCYRFGQNGYCEYSFLVRFDGPEETAFDPGRCRERLEAYLASTASFSDVEPLLLFDGGDHQHWDEPAYGALSDYMDDPTAAFEVRHTSLDAYLEDLLPQQDRIATVLDGELREPACLAEREGQWLIPGVLSSRAWMKQANTHCEHLLCHWAEPLCAWAACAAGHAGFEGFLNTAWRWLLQNHPHDTLCGCSIDQVHRDAAYRFSQAREAAAAVADTAANRLAAAAGPAPAEDQFPVTLFNPLPRPLREPVEVTLNIPSSWPTFAEFFNFEALPAFRLVGPDGREVPFQRLAQSMNSQHTLLFPTRLPKTVRVNRVTVSLPADLPPMGYAVYTVRRAAQGERPRHPAAPGLATSERSMANEALEVAIEPNGTLTVTDRRTGRRTERLLTLEDRADIGDGWYHGVAVNDRVEVSTGAPAQVSLLHDGPLEATFAIRIPLEVPARFRFDTMTRAEERAVLVVEHRVTLRAGCPRIEVETIVDNRVEDHRLRVLFPSGADAETYLADAAFDVVERPVALRPDNHLFRELEIEGKPQQSWTAVHDGGGGLAVAADGLLESAVRDLPGRPLALTLFRATRRTVMTDGEPDGQEQGRLRFRYWILPLTGAPDRVELTHQARQLACGVRAAAFHPLAGLPEGIEPGSRPALQGFIGVEGPLVLSSCRPDGEALELRLYNPHKEAVRGLVRLIEPALRRRYDTVQPVDLESGPAGDPFRPDAEGVIPVALEAKKITTLRLTREKP